MAQLAFGYIILWSLTNVGIAAFSVRRRRYIAPPTHAAFVALLCAFAMVASVLLKLASNNSDGLAILMIMLVTCFLLLIETFRLARGSLMIYSKDRANVVATSSAIMVVFSSILYFG